MVKFYTTMCLFGLVLPYAALLSWFNTDAGLSLSLLWSDLFANGLSTMAWFDVLITAIVLISFIRSEGRRMGMINLFVPVAATCMVGPSFGLPLFLLMRERGRKTQSGDTANA